MGEEMNHCDGSCKYRAGPANILEKEGNVHAAVI